MRIISVKETAQQLNLSPLSLADKRFRIRIGLPAVKLGRRLGFDERDVEQLVLRGRETMPIESRQENKLAATAEDSHV
jgi:hypothetical protein